MIKPKQIDFKSGSFVSNGNKYIKVDDAMGYERLKRFIAYIPTLAYGVDFKAIQEHVAKGLQILRRGNDMAANYMDIVEHLVNFHEQIKGATNEDFFNSNIEQHLDFCCLFIVREGEDMTTWSKSIMEAKKNDWKKDMDMFSFFLLAKSQLPGYKQILRELQLVDDVESSQKKAQS